MQVYMLLFPYLWTHHPPGMYSRTRLNPDSMANSSLLYCHPEETSRSRNHRSPLRLPSSGSPCLSARNDTTVLGSPSRRRARARGCLPPPCRPSKRLHQLTKSFERLSLQSRQSEDGMVEPTKVEPPHRQYLPLHRPSPTKNFAFPCGTSPSPLSSPPSVPRPAPTKDSAFLCGAPPPVSRLSSTKDSALLCGSPMSICKPSLRPPHREFILQCPTPMSICQPSPRQANEDDAIQFVTSFSPYLRHQRRDSIVQPRLTEQPSPRQEKSQDEDFAFQSSVISWASIPPTPRLTIEPPPPRPPQSPAIQARGDQPQSPIFSPPGSWLEELRGMGEYDGPNQVEVWSRAWDMTREEVLDWWYRR